MGIVVLKIIICKNYIKINILSWCSYENPIKIIAIFITNPIAPTKARPIALTFAIVVNSVLSGFFKRCQTRIHFFEND